ncbi:MAG: ion transporter [Bacteroidales bacterium]|nr:ion transporter [Bacteroidales bacterium]
MGLKDKLNGVGRQLRSKAWPALYSFLSDLYTGLSMLFNSAVSLVARIPFGRIMQRVAHLVVTTIHNLLFKFLLPKKYRNLSREEMYSIIFKSDTPAGKQFDIILLILIGFNILVLILDSIDAVHDNLKWLLKVVEWLFTLIFTFEYYLRIYCHKQPSKYIFSFYGLIDLLSIFPAYLSLLLPATQTLTVFRVLRTLRVFRVLHLKRFIDEGSVILNALRRSMYRILIFMLFVFLIAVVLGALVYTFEQGRNPQISSIPEGIYWAVVTLTTVGYGDITPVTTMGRFISVVVMILGYSVIAVPTGIVAGETVNAFHQHNHRTRTDEFFNDGSDDDEETDTNETTTPSEPLSLPGRSAEPMQTDVATPRAEKYCQHCGHEETDPTATFCKHCGTRLSNIGSHSWLGDFFST